MNIENEQNRRSKAILEILESDDRDAIRALFLFEEESEKEILVKFNLWARWFFPQYFKHKDAPFHAEIDSHNLSVYLGTTKYFVDIAFRGAAKTTRTKLFFAFAILNDALHRRKYIKILTKDVANGKQSVTDVYNMLVSPRVSAFYPDLFETSDKRKHEETMNAFDVPKHGVKVRSGTVGTDQRGQLQEDARPDLIWYDDFETRKTLRSAVETQAIWDNMEEARTGLSKDGGALYTCNYLSERGNVHKLVQPAEGRQVLIVPIVKNGEPTWSAYTLAEIETIRQNADDFAGEYLCEPSAGSDIFFDRSTLDRQPKKAPIRTLADFKIFHQFDPSHRYGIGADVSGGVGLDHSASVIIDFSTNPSRVVATFKTNTMAPDVFGHELIRQGEYYNQPIIAVENNKFDMCIGVLKQRDYPRLFFTDIDTTRAGLPPRTRYYGWNTNSDTKPRMLFDLKKAVEDGHIELSDPDLIAELRSYTRDDLMDKEDDVRLTTRHFDLLIACSIAYQMRNWADVAKPKINYQQPAYERSGLSE